MRPSGRLLRAFKGWLDTRAVVRVAGADAAAFLQVRSMFTYRHRFKTDATTRAR
jgi:hypothetical protein|tara:strand:- start:5392 stop:5553 length:162 start_codon:yes stop_codon:yes gene_type:complete